MKLSIIIPVYNSEKTIGKLVDKLFTEMQEINLEIVLINDCSKDKSEQVCLEIFKKYPDKVKFYSLAKNVGEHNTVMAGLNNCSGDYAIIMDDDFQNPVSEVIKLYEYAVQNDFDVVYTYYDKKKHSVIRNLGSKFNDLVANLMLKKPIDLYLSSFKLINRFLIHAIIKYDNPYAYIDGLILRTTSNIGKIKVSHDYRAEGKSQYTIKKLISLWMNMFTSFSIWPLRFATLMGFIFSLFGFGLAIAAVWMKINEPDIPMGYASMMVTIAIFGGIQLIAIGIAGEYVGRIFLSLNKHPQYTIRKSFGN